MRNRYITAALIFTICAVCTGCSNEPIEEIPSVSSLINVDQDNLIYADNSQLESSRPSSDDNGTSSDGENSQASGLDNSNPTGDKHYGQGSGIGGQPSKHPEADDAHNTTIPRNDSKLLDFSVNKITVAAYESYGDGDTKTGFSTYFNLDYYPYGVYATDMLPTNGAKYVDNPLEITVGEGDKSDYAFEFTGAGHCLSTTLKEKGEDCTDPDFWLEVEKDGKVLGLNTVSKQSVAAKYQTAVKGIAVKLTDFEFVDMDGYAVDNPFVPFTFTISSKTGEHELKVGMPFDKFNEYIGGEGQIIRTDVIDEQTETSTEMTYYVYKSKDYTFVIEKKTLKELLPSDSEYADPELYEFANEDLVTLIICIKNEADYSDEYKTSVPTE